MGTRRWSTKLIPRSSRCSYPTRRIRLSIRLVSLNASPELVALVLLIALFHRHSRCRTIKRIRWIRRHSAKLITIRLITRSDKLISLRAAEIALRTVLIRLRASEIGLRTKLIRLGVVLMGLGSVLVYRRAVCGGAILVVLGAQLCS